MAAAPAQAAPNAASPSLHTSAGPSSLPSPLAKHSPRLGAGPHRDPLEHQQGSMSTRLRNFAPGSVSPLLSGGLSLTTTTTTTTTTAPSGNMPRSYSPSLGSPAAPSLSPAALDTTTAVAISSKPSRRLSRSLQHVATRNSSSERSPARSAPDVQPAADGSPTKGVVQGSDESAGSGAAGSPKQKSQAVEAGQNVASGLASAEGPTETSQQGPSEAQQAPPAQAQAEAVDPREEAARHQQHLQQQQAALQQASGAQGIPASAYEARDALCTEVYQAAVKEGRSELVHLMELGRYASQHHLSGYSILKYGSRGSPFAYLPISLQHPDHVNETMTKQAVNEARAAEWLLCKRRRAHQARVMAAAATDSSNLLSIVGEDRTAAASGIKRPPSATAMAEETSSRRTPRLEPSAHLTPVEPVQGAFGGATDADGDERMRSRGSSPAPGRTEDDEAVSSSAPGVGPTAGSSVQITGPLEPPVEATEEASLPKTSPQAAPLTESKTAVNASDAQPSATPAMTGPGGAPTIAAATPQQQAALAMKTSDTHPINISPIVPPDMLDYVSERVLSSLPPCARVARDNATASGLAVGTPQSRAKDAMDSDDGRGDALAPAADGLPHVPTPSAEEPGVHAERQVKGERLIRIRNSYDLAKLAAEIEAEAFKAAQAARAAAQAGASGAPAAPAAQQPSPTQKKAAKEPQTSEQAEATAYRPGPRIGNLLLSSCPGKKVRLSGPVRGRGAICRDLGIDLGRIREMGVGAIVCCLDDEELAFLGAPWQDYEREADRLGLDVIRLPMAEGFAPTDVHTIDAAVTSIVLDYTLRGVHVLVHCRGGVGRAGLIACTWMCKLGFVDGRPDNTSSNRTLETDDVEAEGGGERALMITIGRLVETIRRRRSPKAIETAEQVKFLVDFLQHIHLQEERYRRNLASA